MPETVRITDVSPRDGLQNEPGVIPTEDKVRLVELLCGTGVDEIEVTSFVSPKWVPQLGDGARVCRELAGRKVRVQPKRPGSFSALIPNAKGLESLQQTDQECIQAEVSAGVPFPDRLINKIALFTAASETFSRKNTNASITDSIRRFHELYQSPGVHVHEVRGYVSCAIACPFEGPIAPKGVAAVCRQLIDIGVTELDLGDTIGAGTPPTIKELLEAVRAEIGGEWFEKRALTMHLHDTFGHATDCVKASLDLGVRSFDGSVAGIGGCPYASTPGRRAPGNIDTALLVETIHGAGFKTGVDIKKLDIAAGFARKIIEKARAQG